MTMSSRGCVGLVGTLAAGLLLGAASCGPDEEPVDCKAYWLAHPLPGVRNPYTSPEAVASVLHLGSEYVEEFWELGDIDGDGKRDVMLALRGEPSFDVYRTPIDRMVVTSPETWTMDTDIQDLLADPELLQIVGLEFPNAVNIARVQMPGEATPRLLILPTQRGAAGGFVPSLDVDLSLSPRVLDITNPAPTDRQIDNGTFALMDVIDLGDRAGGPEPELLARVAKPWILDTAKCGESENEACLSDFEVVLIRDYGSPNFDIDAPGTLLPLILKPYERPVRRIKPFTSKDVEYEVIGLGGFLQPEHFELLLDSVPAPFANEQEFADFVGAPDLLPTPDEFVYSGVTRSIGEHDFNGDGFSDWIFFGGLGDTINHTYVVLGGPIDGLSWGELLAGPRAFDLGQMPDDFPEPIHGEPGVAAGTHGGDYDGDGRSDLMLVTSQAYGGDDADLCAWGVALFFPGSIATSDWSIQRARSGESGAVWAGLWAPVGSYESFTYVTYFGAGDLTGDGRGDVVKRYTGNSMSGSLAVLSGAELLKWTHDGSDTRGGKAFSP